MEQELKPAIMAAINRQQSLLYLTLILGHEIFAWDGLQVNDVVGCDAMSEMSGMPPFICGGVYWRGEAVPVVDLQARMNRKLTPITQSTRVIIVETAQGGVRQLLGIMMSPQASVRDGLRRAANARKASAILAPLAGADELETPNLPASALSRRSRVSPQRCLAE